MSTPIFVDTGFVIALINQRDQYHQQAMRLSERFEGHLLLITSAVLLEIGNALSRGYKKEAVLTIEYFFDADEVAIIHLTPQRLEEGFALYKKYEDKMWGLVDCVSMVVMRQNNVNRILTFDKHFAQAGFEVLM